MLAIPTAADKLTPARGAAAGEPQPSNDVSILLGNGDGTFEEVGRGDGSFERHRLYASGRAPYSVAVGDFNGDGLADAVVGSQVFGSVSVLINAGSD